MLLQTMENNTRGISEYVPEDIDMNKSLTPMEGRLLSLETRHLLLQTKYKKLKSRMNQQDKTIEKLQQQIENITRKRSATEEIDSIPAKQSKSDITIKLTSKDSKQNAGAILHNNNIDKNEYNLTTWIKGKDLYLHFETKNEGQHFLEKIRSLPLIARLPYADNPEYRLHWVPSHYSETQIEEILKDNKIEPPKKIIFIPYKKHGKRAFKIALCQTSIDTYEKLQKFEGKKLEKASALELTAKIEPRKCSKCTVLGHTPKNCIKGPNNIYNYGCLDCNHKNWANKDNKNYVRRPSKHTRLTTECPTYRDEVSKSKKRFQQQAIDIPIELQAKEETTTTEMQKNSNNPRTR